MVFRFASLGNPASPSGFAGVPSFAFQVPLQVRLMSTDGQPCSLTIPIASIPTHPPFIFLWIQYIYLQQEWFFKRQNQSAFVAGLSPALSWSWIMRFLFDITSTRATGSLEKWLNVISTPQRGASSHLRRREQQFKILASNQIRILRLNLFFELNGTEVFLW